MHHAQGVHAGNRKHDACEYASNSLLSVPRRRVVSHSNAKQVATAQGHDNVEQGPAATTARNKHATKRFHAWHGHWSAMALQVGSAR